jgi:FKBP-type peptidyl-prolyl cis-trans isomerase SlyD
MDSEGNRLNGTVVEVKDEVVIVDMNHPLAGADLTFIGQVIESRLATNEELQGMVNMMSGEGGCGCGGNCGCGSGDEEGGCGCGSKEGKEEGESCGCGGGGCGCH